MKSLEEALSIIRGSKLFSFESGENGSTILVITGYRSGKTLKLDLANITNSMLNELQVEDENDYDEEEWED